MRTERHADTEEFHRRWRPILMAYFLRRVRDHGEAEDLTQEVFVRLLDHAEAPALDETGHEPYVFQTAINLLRDRHRRARIRDDYRDMWAKAEGNEIDPIDPFRVAAGRIALDTLIGGLADLSERTRTIFLLYRVEHMNQDAIAETYGISRSAVKQHVAKAMGFLLKRMRGVR